MSENETATQKEIAELWRKIGIHKSQLESVLKYSVGSDIENHDVSSLVSSMEVLISSAAMVIGEARGIETLEKIGKMPGTKK